MDVTVLRGVRSLCARTVRDRVDGDDARARRRENARARFDAGANDVCVARGRVADVPGGARARNGDRAKSIARGDRSRAMGDRARVDARASRAGAIARGRRG